ncbi:MAG: GNAT family N-acetyltransferase [Candidatus Hermodarchaeota archaeon]
MNNSLDKFFKITPEYAEKASKVAGSAFQDDPVSIFVYPDEKERRQKLQYGFEVLYNYGIRKGVTYAISNDLEGIIIWLPPDKIYVSFWTMMRYGGFRAMCKAGLKIKAMKRSMAVFKYIESKHKLLAPFNHWYLQNIAVTPEEQRKGYGELLLTAMFKQIDSEGLPIYLETNNERNLSFYQKHGFEILEHEIIPGIDVPLWCMLRKQKQAR